MATVVESVPELRSGDRLSRAEFFRRWEEIPAIVRAELIGGVVHMPSPLSREHGRTDVNVGTWIGTYAAHTPGCEACSNSTWLMLEDAPQPDKDLRILRDYGGQSRTKGKYAAGAPEFLAEMCATSAAYDLHKKMELYRLGGVQEYLTVLLFEHEIRWHRLVKKQFQLMPAGADRIWRSVVFPGLWLDGKALLKGEMAKVLAVLQRGLDSPEHAEFVTKLQRRKASKKSKRRNRGTPKNGA